MRSVIRISFAAAVLTQCLLLLTGCPLLFPPKTSVTVVPGSATIKVGDTVHLTASSTNRNDTTFDWVSSAPEVASVTEGIVTGVAQGIATITATGTDSGKSGKATIKVEAAPSEGESEGEPGTQNSIVTDKNSVNVPEGGTASFQVKLGAQPASNITVSVANVAGDSDISVQSGATLTFSTTLWNVFQAVTLYAAEDADSLYSPATIRCSAPGLTNKNVVATEQDNEGPAKALVGWVHDTGGLPVPFATVTAGTQTSNTDGVGLFRFDAVEEADDLLVSVEADGYTANSRAIDTASVNSPTANFVLKRREVAKSLNIDTGGRVADVMGNALTLAAKSLVTKDGKQVTGDVDVSITALDVTEPDELKAFPGSFSGIALGRKTGETVQLETFALAEYDVRQNGEEVQLDMAKSAVATIQLTLNDDRLAVDEVVPLWYFNEETGLWEEKGDGIVKSDGQGGLYWEANVPHFSWWNCDQPIETKHCISGRVVDQSGNAVRDAEVYGDGVDYSGTSYGMTDAEGYYCMDVKCGSTVTVRVVLPGAVDAVDSETISVPGDCGVTCAGGGCAAVPDLQGYFPSCIEGYVRDGSSGAGIPGVTVYSSVGAIATTDADGYYRMNVPENVAITVYVIGRPAIVVISPPADEPCAQGDFDVELPGDGDVVGQIVSVNLVDQTGLLPDLPAKSFSAQVNLAQFFADIPYGIQHVPPMDLYQVYTMADIEGALGGLEEVAAKALTSIGDLLPTGPLDPGTPGAISDGAHANDMIRLSDFMNDLMYWKKADTPDSIVKRIMAKQFGLFDETLLPFMSGTFVDVYSLLDLLMPPVVPEPPKQLEPGRIANDVPLTFSWPGGLDIGAFDCVVNPGVPVSFTSLETLDNGLTRFDLSGGLNLQWEVPQTPGDIVVLAGAFVSLESADELGIADAGSILKEASDEVFILTCVLQDDGSFTVPLEVVKRNIPGWAANKPLIGALGFGRVYVGDTDVPLTGGGNGTVNLVRAELSFNIGYVPELDAGNDHSSAQDLPMDGTEVYGVVDGPEDTGDWFQFDAVAGHVYVLPIGGSCDVALLDANDTVLATPAYSDYYYRDEEILWRAPTDGVVYVRAQYEGGGLLPMYFLSLQDLGEMPESVTFPDAALEQAIRDALSDEGPIMVKRQGDEKQLEGEGEGWITIPVYDRTVQYGNYAYCSGAVSVSGASDLQVHFSAIDIGSGDQMWASSSDWWGPGLYPDYTTYSAYADSLQLMVSSNGNDPGSFTIDSVSYLGGPDLLPEFSGNLFTSACGDIPQSQGPIPIVDLLRLRYVYATSRGIQDLTGIEWCLRLQSLNLSYNQISDISPLSSLTTLSSLELSNNLISDIGPLTSLTNLWRLLLDSNQILDIGPLTGLTHLERLHLWGNQIADLSPLSGLTNLSYLVLAYNQIADLGPLSGLSVLDEVYLDNNQIADIDPLAGLTSLWGLSLWGNQIADIDPLSGLTNLHWLYLDNNQIADIGALVGLTNLEELHLNSNQIADITPLVDNPGIGQTVTPWGWNQPDQINLCDNPLSEQARNVDIPALEARGAIVEWCEWEWESEGEGE